jgi:hypothetical protein
MAQEKAGLAGAPPERLPGCAALKEDLIQKFLIFASIF